jgi:tRNA dimethylallyltransferase
VAGNSKTADRPPRRLVPGGAYFLVGATGTGKTSVVHQVARESRAHVLSADSMAVYRGMQIGTAAPGSMLREEVPHHGVELIDSREEFSVHEYMVHAGHALQAAKSDDSALLVAGGSGLYVKCLTDGLAETPAADPHLREFWHERVVRDGLQALQDEVQAHLPVAFEALTDSDRKNARRLIRLLERGGSADSAWSSRSGSSTLVGLQIPAEYLKERLRERAAEMMQLGLLEETRSLVAHGLHKTAAQAIGYAEAIDVLNGDQTEEEAVELIARRSWRLARKQMTWFRHQAKVSWIDVESTMSAEDVAQEVRDRWLDVGPVELRV